MIIIGYQGIGKSTLANKDKDYIDLESSNFFFEKEGMLIRDSNWYLPYSNVAFDLCKQGYNVFTSSHAEVRNTIMNKWPEFTLAIVPSIGLKDLWLMKLEERYKKISTDKNYKALMNAKDRYEDNIKEIIDCCKNRTIIIDHIDYDLKKIIEDHIKINNL